MNDFSELQNVIEKYLTNAGEYKEDHRPIFVLVDNAETYKKVISIANCECVKTSDYCKSDDSFPDLDSLFSDLENMSPDSHKILLGFGETLNFRYSPLDENFNLNPARLGKLGRLKELIVPGKLIVLCRHLYNEFQELNRNDRKFNAKRWRYISSPNNDGSEGRILQSSSDLDAETVTGYKNLLDKLESGFSKDICIESELALWGVNSFSSSFDALRYEDPYFNGVQSWLTEEQWKEYRQDKNLKNAKFDEWRYYLKLRLDGSSNVYLQYVAQKSSNFDEYQTKLFNALLEISPDSPEFSAMYSERKELLKDVSDGDISAYVKLTRSMGDKQIYYLTDNTKLERQAIINYFNGKDLAQFDREILKRVYPDLYWYLSPYHFTQVSNPEFEDYFQQYRFLKTANYISEDFLERVNKYSRDGARPFNQLDYRTPVILDEFNPQKTFLYWLDALGVEFLAFIQNWAKDYKLNMSTRIVKANLPTITSENKDFFDEWTGKKFPNKALDKIKHEGISDADNSEQNAVYLEQELFVIKGVLDKIRAILNQDSDKIDSVLLVSDHGASRLAVLSGQENRWEMKNKGEHSGRCCKKSDLDERPDCVSEGHGFWAIANYERFKGGRKGDVEVHGGATLEEVLVPVIEFSRKNDIQILVKNSTVIIGRDKKAQLEFFCSRSLENPVLKWNDQLYPIERQDSENYIVHFSNVNVRAGDQNAEVWENDTFIANIDFTLEKGGVKINKDDDLF